MKVIFLDIDGVLNSSNFFKDFVFNYSISSKLGNDLEEAARNKMQEIDFSKLLIIKDIVNKTGAKIVITSSWKNLDFYPIIEKKLIEFGLPIIGTTIDSGSDRGCGIRKYLESHDVEKFVIIDDDFFDDYDAFLLDNIVKTDFYDDGLQKKQEDELLKN